MEGYSLSGSLDSYTKYKYREYVAGNQKVYEITETTKVEIVVNGGNNKFYTHPKMPDGEYYIRVWLDNINLGKMSGVDYSSINDTLKGVILDNIKITEKGLTYAEKGTILHFVMQHLDYGREDIEARLKKWWQRFVDTSTGTECGCSQNPAFSKFPSWKEDAGLKKHKP